MERTYESAAALVGRAAGPLAGHLGAFVSSLIDQQYTASIYIKAQHALALDRWLAKRGAELADLDDVYIERYQHRRRELKQRVLDAVTPLNGKPGRYRPDDKLLAFLKGL